MHLSKFFTILLLQEWYLCVLVVMYMNHGLHFWLDWWLVCFFYIFEAVCLPIKKSKSLFKDLFSLGLTTLCWKWGWMIPWMPLLYIWEVAHWVLLLYPFSPKELAYFGAKLVGPNWGPICWACLWYTFGQVFGVSQFLDHCGTLNNCELAEMLNSKEMIWCV